MPAELMHYDADEVQALAKFFTEHRDHGTTKPPSPARIEQAFFTGDVVTFTCLGCSESMLLQPWPPPGVQTS